MSDIAVDRIDLGPAAAPPRPSVTGGFDIDEQAAIAASSEAEGRVIHVVDKDEIPMYYRNGTGEDKPVTMTVVGQFSPQYRQAQHQLRQRKLKVNKLNGLAIHEDSIFLAAACVTAWDGFFSAGEMVRCDRQNVAKVLERCPHTLRQVTEEIEDHQGFSRTASPGQ